MLAFPGLLLYGFVHWNARMTEMERSGIEVFLCSQITLEIFLVISQEF